VDRQCKVSRLRSYVAPWSLTWNDGSCLFNSSLWCLPPKNDKHANFTEATKQINTHRQSENLLQHLRKQSDISNRIEFPQSTISEQIKDNRTTYAACFVSGTVSGFVNCDIFGMGDFYNIHSKHTTDLYDTKLTVI